MYGFNWSHKLSFKELGINVGDMKDLDISGVKSEINVPIIHEITE